MIKIQLLDYKYVAGVINWNESVVGTLDVGDSENFPFALTFSVADVRTLNSRTGTYSKTFKIPATKNNNKILKSSYNEGYYLETNTISNKKQCRIEVDNSYSNVGLLQITAIGKSSNPLYYSCVFYGNNVDWASSLDNKLLKDLSTLGGANGSGWNNLNGKTVGGGVGLKVQHDEIVATWDTDNALLKTASGGSASANNSPIVYPIVGYGENNEGGLNATIQLLQNAYVATGGNSGKIGYDGWDNYQVDYPNPTPSCDWRPAIFIYDIFKQIFNQEGYSVVSNFIETDMFKRLLMLLPNFKHNNPDERVDDNSIIGSFQSGAGETAYIGSYDVVSPSQSASAFYWPYFPILFNGNGQAGTGNFTTVQNSSMYNDSNGEFTIQEFGFYDINIDNIGFWLQSVCDGSADRNEVWKVRIFIEIKTAGQTSWNRVAEGSAVSTEIYYSNCPNPPTGEQSYDFEGISIENQWLNKNDKVRFTLQYKMGHGDSGPNTTGWIAALYGGTNPTADYPSGTSNKNGSLSILHKGVNVEYGQTYDLKNVIDNESTQLGFLKGVIHAFNLQFTTDTVSKIIYVEPFNDFYKNQNEAIDWTNKIDLSNIQEDKWVDSDLRREVIFKYKTDSNDKKVEHRGLTYWDGILDEFPYREFLSSDFEVGKSIFENPFFAGSYNGHDGMTSGFGAYAYDSTPYRANLWGLCESGAIPNGWQSCRPDKGYNFTPRLLNYIKMECSTVSTSSRFYAQIQTWGVTQNVPAQQIIYDGQQNPSVTYPILARACSVDAYTDFNDIRQPLTYASVTQGTYDCTTSSFGANVGYKGLYQTYYQSMIEMAKSNPRIKTLYVNLKLSDVVNLDLRKLVYIDGYYYRLNRIIDYKPNNNQTTKVELVLWDDKSYFPVNVNFNS